MFVWRLLIIRQTHLVENPKEIVRPLGSWSQRGVHAHEGVAAKRSLVDIVERADFLIRRVFPKNKKKEQRNVNVSN